MNQNPPPGWYTDPGDPRGQRWWDGGAWTAHTAPGAAAGAGAPWADVAGGQPVGATTPYVAGRQPGAPRGVFGLGPAGANRLALGALGLAGAYVALAVLAHVWVLGIVPILLSIRAMRAGSRLGIVALVVSIGAVVAGIALASGHTFHR